MESPQQKPALATKLTKLMIVAVLVFTIAPGFGWCVWIAIDIYGSSLKREYLLHKADHTLLLEESRKLIRNYPDEDIFIGDKRLHPIFERIKTLEVMIKKDYAIIVLHGAFDHYGAYAFLEGVEPFGDQELIPGLWYVSD